MQQRMVEEGIVTVKPIPMGVEKVFLKVDEEEDFKEVVKDSASFVNKLFSVIREWETKDVVAGRNVWCRIHGLPIHAWRKKSSLFYQQRLEVSLKWIMQLKIWIGWIWLEC